MAQWIRHQTTNTRIAGSSPAVVKYFFFYSTTIIFISGKSARTDRFSEQDGLSSDNLAKLSLKKLLSLLKWACGAAGKRVKQQKSVSTYVGSSLDRGKSFFHIYWQSPECSSAPTCQTKKRVACAQIYFRALKRSASGTEL